MALGSRIFAHSRNFQRTRNVLRDRGMPARCFTNDAWSSVGARRRDDSSGTSSPGIHSMCQDSIAKYSDGSYFGSHQQYANHVSLVSAQAVNQRIALWTSRKLLAPAIGIDCGRSKGYLRTFSTGSGLPPHQEIGMPSLSPTMTEGNIARWLKKEGEKISAGEVLCEVETDKATVEMECMEEGYLAKILHKDGSSGIKVGEVIAITVEEEEDIAKFKDYSPSTSDSASEPAAQPPSTPSPSPSNQEGAEQSPSFETKSSKPIASSSPGDRIFSSPLARKLAEDHNVSVSSIKGTGLDGRIVKADVEDYLASHAKEVRQAGKVDTIASVGLDYIDLPHSQIRKITASRLLQSKQTIPHYYLTVDTCVDKLVELRGRLNSLQEAAGGKKISINDLVIKAAAFALKKVPQCNSSWTNDYIRQYHNVNINVAVQTDHGLFVPVIRDADKKGLAKIADEVKSVAQKARDNSLKPEDYEGGTFTVSNLGGPFGIKQFCAIINPPQAGILAVGSAERRVIPSDGPEVYKFASFMSVTLSCDHRVIDGAVGAEWLKSFKGYVENPESLLL